MVAAPWLMPFLLLALLAFTRASSARLPVKVPYQQPARSSYDARRRLPGRCIRKTAR